MKTLVTGATGFVGARVVADLADRGHSVVAVHRGDRPSDWHSSIQSLKVTDLDMLDTASLRGCDAVVHLAGMAHRKAGDEATFIRVNGESTEQLGLRALEAGVGRFIFLSTAKVHGDVTRGSPVSASSPYHPTDAYSRSKVMAEEALIRLSRSGGLAVVLIRPPLVIGEDARGNIGLLRSMLDRRLPVPVPRRENRRSFVHIDRLSEEICSWLDREATGVVAHDLADAFPSSTETLVKSLSPAARVLRLPGRLFQWAAPVCFRLFSVDLGPLYSDFEVLDSQSRLD